MKKEKQSPMAKAMALTDLSSDKTDPNGSYTGKPVDKHEQPVQDADDL